MRTLSSLDIFSERNPAEVPFSKKSQELVFRDSVDRVIESASLEKSVVLEVGTSDSEKKEESSFVTSDPFFLQKRSSFFSPRGMKVTFWARFWWRVYNHSWVGLLLRPLVKYVVIPLWKYGLRPLWKVVSFPFRRSKK